MLYKEVVERLRENRGVSPRDCKGIFLFYLLQDREIKNVKFRNKVYEVNFISTNEYNVFYNISEDTCSTWNDAMRKMEVILTQIIDYKNQMYITIDDEVFEVVIEELESDE